MTPIQRVASKHLTRSVQASDIWVLTSAANDLEEINNKLRDVVDTLEGAELADPIPAVSRIIQKLRTGVSRELGEMARTLHGLRPKGRDHLAGTESGRGMSASDSTLDNATKSRISGEFKRVGLDGNKPFPKASAGLTAALDVLADFEIESTTVVSAHSFLRDSGQLHIDLAYMNFADSFSPEAISNSVLVLSWHKFEATGRYEVLAYLS